MIEITMTLSALFSIIIGIIVLVWKKSLNYAIGLWLIVSGLLKIINLSLGL